MKTKKKHPTTIQAVLPSECVFFGNTCAHLSLFEVPTHTHSHTDTHFDITIFDISNSSNIEDARTGMASGSSDNNHRATHPAHSLKAHRNQRSRISPSTRNAYNITWLGCVRFTSRRSWHVCTFTRIAFSFIPVQRRPTKRKCSSGRTFDKNYIGIYVNSSF